MLTASAAEALRPMHRATAREALIGVCRSRTGIRGLRTLSRAELFDAGVGHVRFETDLPESRRPRNAVQAKCLGRSLFEDEVARVIPLLPWLDLNLNRVETIQID